MILLLATAIMAFVVAVCMTPLIRKLASRLNVYAKPNHRTIHKQVVPLLGGISIFAAYLFSFSLLIAFAPSSLDALIEESIVFIGAGFLILLLGIYDDIKGANSTQKLTTQIIAATLVIISGYKVSAVILPIGGIISLGIFSVPVTLLWIVGITNAINLIDGLDGLAAGISMGAALIMLAVSLYFGNIASAFPAAILASSLAAFLLFNFNPAKIFLGDSGSLFIGFMLGCFSINGTFRESSAVAMLIPMIVLGIPITDTILAVIRRLRKGVHPFHADREHIHHRLLNLGLSHRKVVLLIYAISLSWGLIAMLIFISSSPFMLVFLIPIAGTILYGLRRLGFTQYFKLGHKPLEIQ